MPLELVCPQGHCWRVPNRAADGVVHCPQCGRAVSIPAGDGARVADQEQATGTADDLANSQRHELPADSQPLSQRPPAARSLWQVMERAAETEKSAAAPSGPPSDAAGAQASAAESPETTEPSDAAQQPVRKGLWEVMGQRRTLEGPVESVETGTDRSSPGSERREQAGGSAKTHVAPPATADAEDEFAHEQSGGDQSGESAVWEPPVLIETVPPPLTPRPPVRPGRSRTALAGFALGLAALPCSVLAVLPSVWAGLPATVSGFTALALGMAALGEISRSRGRQTGRGLAVAAMIAGVAGMFLGPLVFVKLGENWQQTRGRQQTTGRLEAIGAALNDYHADRGRFPSGGFAPDGREIPGRSLHSWATALLPYLGEGELYRQIDLNRPFDHDVNFPAVSRDVPAFFAAGADRRKVGRGYAVIHFAGVGGEAAGPDGQTVRVGLFGRSSGLSRGEITDGLSQTLAAGEINHRFPPWGEPENWRTVGVGLNKDPSGFGNADRTGALFLKADGSVRFYSNKTPPDILHRLSTPDAGDQVPGEFR